MILMPQRTENLYEEDWAEYRRIRNFTALVYLLGLPTFAVLSWLGSLIFPKMVLYVMTPLGIGWFVVSVYNGFRLQLLRCPRCGEWFSATWWYNLSVLARKCVHCGLPKFSTQD